MHEFRFINELIGETIKFFKQEDGVDFSKEQAIEALNGLGNLYLAFANKNGTNLSKTQSQQEL
jgi:hypothetical protein